MTSTTFFFVFIPILAIILLAVNLIFAPHNPYQEKDSAFECGFHSFLGQNRTQFSISFFIFALLFLLFDLEILLVYPYVVSAYNNGIYGLVIMLIFFLALTLGFAFELGKNALKIDSRQMLTLNDNIINKISFISIIGFGIYYIRTLFINFVHSKIIYKIISLFLIGYFIRAGYALIDSNINFFYNYTEVPSLVFYFFMAILGSSIEYFKLFDSLPTMHKIFTGLDAENNPLKLPTNHNTDKGGFKPGQFDPVDSDSEGGSDRPAKDKGTLGNRRPKVKEDGRATSSFDLPQDVKTSVPKLDPTAKLTLTELEERLKELENKLIISREKMEQYRIQKERFKGVAKGDSAVLEGFLEKMDHGKQLEKEREDVLNRISSIKDAK